MACCTIRRRNALVMHKQYTSNALYMVYHRAMGGFHTLCMQFVSLTKAIGVPPLTTTKGGTV